MDGGILHTAINATTLALIDAGIPMSDFVCACSAGVVNSVPILDLNMSEEGVDVPTLTIAILEGSGKAAMVGLESRLHISELEGVMECAKEGCEKMCVVLKQTVRKRTEELAST
jgi:exosome complex component RRP41